MSQVADEVIPVRETVSAYQAGDYASLAWMFVSNFIKPLKLCPSFVTKGSPKINPKDVANKTPDQIDKLAKDKGLVPKGPDPKAGKGAYVDPVTGKQRVLCHTNCSNPHGHVNNPQGQRLDINGNVVPPESPAAHLPIKLQ